MEVPLERIREITGGEIQGDGRVLIRGINSLDAASPGDISFYTGVRYSDSLARTRATAVIVRAKTELFQGPQLVVADPSLAHAKVATLFADPVPPYSGGISEKAEIHESARIGRGVSLYPYVVVCADAALGDGTILFSGVHVGKRVEIGARCVIYPNVAILDDCRLGNNVIVHAGSVIGSDGFGFAYENGAAVKIPHRGIVQIDDDVELGANNCVDRAVMGKTWIQKGVKTDNLVHIGHNVVIGENTILIAQVGISGSVSIGRNAVIGGQAGISDHVKIGDGAFVGAQSGIAKSIPPGSIVAGSPSMPYRVWLKSAGLIKQLPETSQRLRMLEKKMAMLEKQKAPTRRDTDS